LTDGTLLRGIAGLLRLGAMDKDICTPQIL
jgi:hypothetical protein